MTGGGWGFFSPRPGWLAWITDEATLVVFNGGHWAAVFDPGLGAVDRLSVNAALADETNRLAVRAPAILFDHAGSSHRLKLNKNAAPATTSLVLQSGYSGHAELGLCGDNEFRLKLSGDGST